MSGFFENIGFKAGHALQKGKLLADSTMGSEEKAREADKYIGGMLAAEIIRSCSLSTDVSSRDLVREVGEQLAARLKDKTLEFNWYVYNTKETNAFALPGGYMFIGRPVLELCRMDRDEVAFILAHEIAHVVKRHAAARMVTESLLSAVAHVTRPRSVISLWLQKVGIKYLTRSYSRANETEADEFAVRLIRAAGFDPEGAVRMLEHLQEEQKHNTQLSISRYFDTHPSISERINQIKKQRN